MPNWCLNNAVIRHNDLAMLEKARDGFNRKNNETRNDAIGMLSALIPCPEPLYETRAGSYGRHDELSNYRSDLLELQENLNLKYFGHKNWYDWCIAEWGTKWDIGLPEGFEEVEIEHESITINFESAWAPPIRAYEKLEAMGFVITASYYEPGCEFCGEYKDGMDYIYDIRQAPEHLDAMYGISETLAEYED
jgi:hypothetical protein